MTHSSLQNRPAHRECALSARLPRAAPGFLIQINTGDARYPVAIMTQPYWDSAGARQPGLCRDRSRTPMRNPATKPWLNRPAKEHQGPSQRETAYVIGRPVPRPPPSLCAATRPTAISHGRPIPNASHLHILPPTPFRDRKDTPPKRTSTRLWHPGACARTTQAASIALDPRSEYSLPRECIWLRS